MMLDLDKLLPLNTANSLLNKQICLIDGLKQNLYESKTRESAQKLLDCFFTISGLVSNLQRLMLDSKCQEYGSSIVLTRSILSDLVVERNELLALKDLLPASHGTAQDLFIDVLLRLPQIKSECELLQTTLASLLSPNTLKVKYSLQYLSIKSKLLSLTPVINDVEEKIAEAIKGDYEMHKRNGFLRNAHECRFTTALLHARIGSYQYRIIYDYNPKTQTIYFLDLPRKDQLFNYAVLDSMYTSAR